MTHSHSSEGEYPQWALLDRMVTVLEFVALLCCICACYCIYTCCTWCPHIGQRNWPKRPTSKLTNRKVATSRHVEFAQQSESAKKKIQFMWHLVKLFHFQRKWRYQFAVLFVSYRSGQDIFDSETTFVEFQTKRSVVDSPKKATDSSHPTFPRDNKICM